MIIYYVYPLNAMYIYIYTCIHIVLVHNPERVQRVLRFTLAVRWFALWYFSVLLPCSALHMERSWLLQNDRFADFLITDSMSKSPEACFNRQIIKRQIHSKESCIVFPTANTLTKKTMASGPEAGAQPFF